jgi:hypothetical protein
MNLRRRGRRAAEAHEAKLGGNESQVLTVSPEPRLAQRGLTDESNTILPRMWGAVPTPAACKVQTVEPPFLLGNTGLRIEPGDFSLFVQSRLATSIE